jgi:hypothetical protein
MTKARDIASATTPNANAALLATFPHRNLIINGAMQVAQRGTSFTFAHDGTKSAYTLDRFYCISGGSYSEWDCVVTQDSDSPSGFSSCLKLTTGTAEASVGADEYYYLQQRIEAQNLQHLDFGSSTAKKLTLSFWIKSSITGTYAVMFYRQDSARTINTTYTIDSANTWEYKTITIDGDTTGAISNDNGQGISIYWGFASGTDYNSTISSSWAAYAGTNLLGGQTANGVVTTAGATFQLTGVQLELGDTATPFEHRSYGDELARCQRYYYEYSSANSDFLGLGNVYQTDQVICPVYSPTVMRALPTLTKTLDGSSQWLTTYDGFTGTNSNASTSLNSRGTSTIASSYIYITGTGRSGSDGQCHWLVIKAGAALHFDAEL